MAGTSVLDAIIERVIEKTKKDNPDKDIMKKPKKEKVPRKSSRRKKLH